MSFSIKNWEEIEDAVKSGNSKNWSMEVRLLVWEMERNKWLQHQLADLTIESLKKEWPKRMVGVGEQ